MPAQPATPPGFAAGFLRWAAPGHPRSIHITKVRISALLLKSVLAFSCRGPYSPRHAQDRRIQRLSILTDGFPARLRQVINSYGSTSSLARTIERSEGALRKWLRGLSSRTSATCAPSARSRIPASNGWSWGAASGRRVVGDPGSGRRREPWRRRSRAAAAQLQAHGRRSCVPSARKALSFWATRCRRRNSRPSSAPCTTCPGAPGSWIRKKSRGSWG